MTEQRLWELICQNASHIRTINRELGEMLGEIGRLSSSVEWIKGVISWQFAILSLILASLVINVLVVRKNNRRG